MAPSLGLGIGLPMNIAVAPFAGLLDLYPNATAAYSLRKLRADYAGSAIRVRRSIDDSELDIGFDSNNDLDQTALLNHCVPTEVQAKFNDAAYFSGQAANEGIQFLPTGGDVFGFNGASKIEMRGKFFIVGDVAPTTDFIFNSALDGVNTGFSVAITTSNELRVAGRSQDTDSFQFFTHTELIQKGVEYEFHAYLDYANDEASITIVGAGTQTGAVTFGSSSYVYSTPTLADSLGYLGSINNTTLNGSVYDIEILVDDSLVASYNGNGNQASDWEDQTGSADGSIVGGLTDFTGQGFDGFVTNWYDQSGATVRNGAQATAAHQPTIVSNGAIVFDSNSNLTQIWDGNDDMDVAAGFSGLTSANVYVVTENSGTVSRTTLTGQNISSASDLSTIITSITYDRVTAIIIYPDATNQAAIEAAIDALYGI